MNLAYDRVRPHFCAKLVSIALVRVQFREFIGARGIELESLDNTWEEAATTTHQDHVIAHVIGTTVLGYLVLRDAIHLLLDIGFVWKIYVDGEMGLLPHPVAVGELEAEDELLTQLKLDIDLLLNGGDQAEPTHFVPLTTSGPLIEVHVFDRDNGRKLLLTGENGSIEIQTSMKDDSIQLTEG